MLLPRSRSRAFAAGVVAIAVLGLAVRPHALLFGFAADDYAQLAMIRGLYPVERAPLDLFTFSDGSPAEAQRLMQTGFYPWYAHPGLRLSMLRPFASALMWLDHALFGLEAVGYHLHSALWWLALVAALAWVLRRWLHPAGVLAALVFFVLDETHGVMLGWIANRNAIMSAAFCVVGLGGYLDWREHRRRAGAMLALGSFLLALAAGEYALSLLGYFVAYELVAAPGRPDVRARSLAILVVPAALYLLVRALAGYGSTGSDMYIDPFAETRSFLAHAPGRYATLTSDIVLAMRADWWTFGFPWAPDLVRRGWAPGEWVLRVDPWRPWQEGFGYAGLLLAAWVYRAALRSAPPGRARHLRWLGLGSLLALFPLVAGFPSSRSLVAPLVGWCVLLGALVTQSWTAFRARRSWGAGLTLVTAGLLGAFHVVAPVIHTWTETRKMADASSLIKNVILAADVDDVKLPAQRVILMSSSEPTTGIYFSLVRGLFGHTMPRAHWTLNPTHFPYALHRPGASTLIVELLQGGTMLQTPFERMFRAQSAVVRRGQRFELDGLAATLLELRDGSPVKVRYDFASPPDDGSWVFLHARPRGLLRFPIPPVGGAVYVPPPVPYYAFGRE